ncbi:hypothetical protein M0R45_003497 [Rubus argutus]|uniref:Caffeoyl-CoA O-methyltransferase n=1 Tax=Rubus argutus TaxID=59490 RepID=A0AAW1YFK0_RUBAR
METEKFSKGLLQSDELYQYILETSVYPREPAPLKELTDATASLPLAGLATAPDSAQLIAMLLKLIDAKKTIELGVFAGYSLLLTALTIPEDGKIVAIDINLLDKLLEHPENEGSFDFAYVDADKVNNRYYHDRLLKLLKVGGLVVYDNTLVRGSVAVPEELVPELRKQRRQAAIDHTKTLAADPRIQISHARIQISHASVGDGMMICRRII